jgi:hypothetical protein
MKLPQNYKLASKYNILTNPLYIASHAQSFNVESLNIAVLVDLLFLQKQCSNLRIHVATCPS